MNIPTELLESLFEGRGGAALTLSTARARVTITRMESDVQPDVWYQLSGDTAGSGPLQENTAAGALAVALDCLGEYAS